MKRFYFGLLCLVVLWGLSGCKGVIVSTVVNKDGSFDRTLSFNAGNEEKPNTLERYFVLPKGAGWKTERSSKPDYVTIDGKRHLQGYVSQYTATRKFGEGESVEGDFAVKASDLTWKPPIVVNCVTVQRLSPTRIEYREVLEWQGPRTDLEVYRKRLIRDDEMFACIQKQLPPNLLTPTNTPPFREALFREMWRTVSGALIAGQEITDEKSKTMWVSLCSGMVERLLGTSFRSEITLEHRKKIARKSAEDFSRLEANYWANMDGIKYASSELNEFMVIMPGPIWETNGIRLKQGEWRANKQYSGKEQKDGRGGKMSSNDFVSRCVAKWYFVPALCLLEPIELRAVCEVKP